VLIVTVHAPVPEHAPPQPTKVVPVAGQGVNVTVVSGGYVSEQSSPQLIPEGVDTTEPRPVPAVLTSSVEDPALPAAPRRTATGTA
jgi:hypothetical protein